MKPNIGSSQKVSSATILLEKNLKARSSVVDDKNILIKQNLRHDWAEAAKQMHNQKDDELLLEDFQNEFDLKEWTW